MGKAGTVYNSTELIFIDDAGIVTSMTRVVETLDLRPSVPLHWCSNSADWDVILSSFKIGTDRARKKNSE